MEKKCVLGIDYGTDSVRVVLVDAADGSEISSAVSLYPRWKAGKYCNPRENMFRQHPLDHIECLEKSVKEALSKAPAGTASRVSGIAVDTTGSTPAPVNREGVPLALTPGFEENPNAMFILWKDHTAIREAEEINRTAKTWGGTDFTRYEGGVYSSEWFWAKILHVLREDAAVRNAAWSWMEHCDWVPALLSGTRDVMKVKRSRCAAGHKAMWHEEFGGLPSEDFLRRLDPLLAGLRDRLYRDTWTSEVSAGGLSAEWAKRLGLPEGIPVAVGDFDAHVGGVGGQITAGSLVKVIGTSTCDMFVAPMDEKGVPLVQGICGQVDGSIIPGMLGLEAGQSAFGDVYAWFKTVLAWPLDLLKETGVTDEGTAQRLSEAVKDMIIPALSKTAELIPPGESGLVAVDWLNGRRTPFADQTLKGAIFGLTLGTDAPRIFRALVEATAFGSRAIVERFEDEGVMIRDVIAIGGVARKSPLVMQIIADVLNRRVRVSKANETVALGAAMFAAVAAGIYATIEEAQDRMGSGFETEYTPDPARAAVYDRLYRQYLAAGNFIETGMKEKTHG